VFYLDTNGPDGKVDFQDVNQKSLRFRHSAADFGMSDQMYKEFFGLDQGDVKNIVDGWDDVGAAVSFRAGSSSTPALEESVEDIRENAPMNFMAGNRLVTRTDYEYYLKSAHMVNVVGEDVVDVKCMNNWEYMASFYRWLYQLGVNGKLVEYADAVADPPRPSPDRYLQKANFIRYEYFYADAADANNIYIWLKTPSGGFDVARTTSNLNQQLQPIKVMTAEIVACKAIDVEFAVCAAPYEYVLKNYLGSGYDVQAGIDRQCESYIEVTLDDNAVCVPSSVKSDVREAILQAFDVNRCSLGQVVRFDQILDGIYAIDGVVKVRTVFRYYDSEGMERSRAYDGLSFASWSDAKGLIRYGDDLNVSNTMRQLEDFQFPVFSGADTLDSRIKVIKKSLANVNTIKF